MTCCHRRRAVPAARAPEPSKAGTVRAGGSRWARRPASTTCSPAPMTGGGPESNENRQLPSLDDDDQGHLEGGSIQWMFRVRCVADGGGLGPNGACCSSSSTVALVEQRLNVQGRNGVGGPRPRGRDRRPRGRVRPRRWARGGTRRLADQGLELRGGHPPDVLHAWTPLDPSSMRSSIGTLPVARRPWSSPGRTTSAASPSRSPADAGRIWPPIWHWWRTGPWAQNTCVPRPADALLLRPPRSPAPSDALSTRTRRREPASPSGRASNWTAFRPDLPTPAFRVHHGRACRTLVLAYAGAVHPANRAEVREPLRGGRPPQPPWRAHRPAPLGNGPRPLPRRRPPGRAVVRSLGWIGRSPRSRSSSPRPMCWCSRADAGPYNDHASPRSCRDPRHRPPWSSRTNLGLVLDPDVEAVVVDDADSEAVADTVAALHADPARGRRSAPPDGGSPGSACGGTARSSGSSRSTSGLSPAADPHGVLLHVTRCGSAATPNTTRRLRR